MDTKDTNENIKEDVSGDEAAEQAAENLEGTSKDISGIVRWARNSIQESVFVSNLYASSVPNQITKKVLSTANREEIDASQRASSSIIEDFIASYIKNNADKKEEITEEDIIRAFFDQHIPEQIQAFNEEVQQEIEGIDTENIEEIISKKDIEKIKSLIIDTMKSLGITEDELNDVKNTEVKITMDIQSSHAREGGTVTISLPQAVRKAIDYRNVYGDERPLEDVVKELLLKVVAHELGHKAESIGVKKAAKSICSQISTTWEPDFSIKSERFAEFIAQNVLAEIGEDLAEVSRNDYMLLQLQVQRLWGVLKKYNERHENKLDINVVFISLKEILKNRRDKDSQSALKLLEAREGAYLFNPPESYLLPFTKEEIKEAVEKVKAKA